MNNNKTITLHVFSTTTLLGSPQSITFVPSLAYLENPACVMLPNIDYTVAYFDGQSKVDVVWRNNHNLIQFCGSAAYGISHYLLHTFDMPYLTISSPHITLQAVYDSEVCLYIPSKSITLSSQQVFEQGRLYHHPDTGIYFLEVEDKDSLQQADWTEEKIYSLPLNDPHGFCLFYWHSATQTGYVRYFTPWHGRIEDSVTGSIQCYLTTHVANLYGIAEQSWIQLSDNGGQIHTHFMGNRVKILGSCHYDSV